MKNIKTFAISTMVLASASANAELVSTDYLVEGDSLATLDTKTGLEWLDLDVTRRGSLNSIEDRLDTDLSGWRFPTYDEVKEYMLNAFESLDKDKASTTGNDYVVWDADLESTPEDVSRFFDLMSNDSDIGAAGLHYDNDGVAVISGYQGSWNDEIQFSRYNGTYGPNYTHKYYGVWLVSDGGTTLSSIQDPSINIPRNATSVPLTASLGLFALGLAGFRRKFK